MQRLDLQRHPLLYSLIPRPMNGNATSYALCHHPTLPHTSPVPSPHCLCTLAQRTTPALLTPVMCTWVYLPQQLTSNRGLLAARQTYPNSIHQAIRYPAKQLLLPQAPPGLAHSPCQLSFEIRLLPWP